MDLIDPKLAHIKLVTSKLLESISNTTLEGIAVVRDTTTGELYIGVTCSTASAHYIISKVGMILLSIDETDLSDDEPEDIFQQSGQEQ
jgi:hypothetical protein